MSGGKEKEAIKRLTTENYTKESSNIYELVVIASRRAARLAEGVRPLVPVPRNLKPTLAALEELAAGKLKVVTEGDSDAGAK